MAAQGEQVSSGTGIRAPCAGVYTLWMQTFAPSLELRVEFRDLRGATTVLKTSFDVLIGSDLVSQRLLEGYASDEAAERSVAAARRALKSRQPETGLKVVRKRGDGRLEISGVRRGSPAALARVRVGDVLLRINGRSVAGLSGAQVESLLEEAPVGSVLRLDIERDSVQLAMPVVASGGKGAQSVKLARLLRRAAGYIAAADLKKGSGGGAPASAVVSISAADYPASVSRGNLNALSTNGLILYFAFCENLPLLEEANYAAAEVVMQDLELDFALRNLEARVAKIQSDFSAEQLAAAKRRAVNESGFAQQGYEPGTSALAGGEGPVAEARQRIASHRASSEAFLEKKAIEMKAASARGRDTLMRLRSRMDERARSAMVLHSEGRNLLEPQLLLAMLVLSHVFRARRVQMAILRFVRSHWDRFEESELWPSSVLMADFNTVEQTIQTGTPLGEYDRSTLSALLSFLPAEAPTTYPVPTPPRRLDALQSVFQLLKETEYDATVLGNDARVPEGDASAYLPSEERGDEVAPDERGLKEAKQPAPRGLPASARTGVSRNGKTTRRGKAWRHPSKASRGFDPPARPAKPASSRFQSASSLSYQEYLKKNFGTTKKGRGSRSASQARPRAARGDRRTPMAEDGERFRTSDGAAGRVSPQSRWGQSTQRFDEENQLDTSVRDAIERGEAALDGPLTAEFLS